MHCAGPNLSINFSALFFFDFIFVFSNIILLLFYCAFFFYYSRDWLLQWPWVVDAKHRKIIHCNHGTPDIQLFFSMLFHIHFSFIFCCLCCFPFFYWCCSIFRFFYCFFLCSLFFLLCSNFLFHVLFCCCDIAFCRLIWIDSGTVWIGHIDETNANFQFPIPNRKWTSSILDFIWIGALRWNVWTWNIRYLWHSFIQR